MICCGFFEGGPGPEARGRAKKAESQLLGEHEKRGGGGKVSNRGRKGGRVCSLDDEGRDKVRVEVGDGDGELKN